MKKDMFEIVNVDESNARFVGEITRSVYGEGFHVRHLYEPDVLCSEIKAGRLIASMAVDENGHTAGYISMFKTAPNQRIWEIESIAVKHEYPNTHISLPLHLANYCVDLVRFQLADADGFYGEVVCSHRFTQFAANKNGTLSCAIQLDQLDGESYKDEKSNEAGAARISCVLVFWEKTKPPEGPLYAPEPYNKIVKYITDQLNPRNILPSTAALPAEGATSLTERFYPYAQIMVVNIESIGGDWTEVVDDILNEVEKHRIISLQMTLNMACPWIGAAVSIMRGKGFFFGGVAPRWFGTDGLLMQKLFGGETEYDKIKLYTKTARKILAFIKSDREAGLNSEE